MMTNEGSTKIVNFMTPDAGFLCYGMSFYIILWKSFFKIPFSTVEHKLETK